MHAGGAFHHFLPISGEILLFEGVICSKEDGGYILVALLY